MVWAKSRYSTRYQLSANRSVCRSPVFRNGNPRMDCLFLEVLEAAAKVCLATVYQKHSSLRTRKRMYRGWHLTNARRSNSSGRLFRIRSTTALFKYLNLAKLRSECGAAERCKPWWMSAITIIVLRLHFSWFVKGGVRIGTICIVLINKIYIQRKLSCLVMR